MLNLFKFLILLLLPFSSFAVEGQVRFQSSSPHIIDGDTIAFGKIRFRLTGIDAPESSQLCKDSSGKNYHCGRYAANFLANLVKGKTVFCRKLAVGYYGRNIANCYVKKQGKRIYLTEELLRNGWAIKYSSRSKKLIKAEAFAKNHRLGMWQGEFDNPKKHR